MCDVRIACGSFIFMVVAGITYGIIMAIHDLSHHAAHVVPYHNSTPSNGTILENNDVLKLTDSRILKTILNTSLSDIDCLAGKDEIEFALCDLVMDGLWHMFAKIRRAQIHQLSKDERIAIIKTMIAEDVPGYLNGFEKMLKDRKSEDEFLVGKEVTWCDIGLTLALAALKYRHGLSLESHPLIVSYMAKMMELPQMAEFLAKKAQDEAGY